MPANSSSTEKLRKINREITERSEEYDVFDLEIPPALENAIIEILNKRGFEYRKGDDISLLITGTKLLIVGKPGADFEAHEKER